MNTKTNTDQLLPGFVGKISLQHIQVQSPPPLKITWVLIDNSLENPLIFFLPVTVPIGMQNNPSQYNLNTEKEEFGSGQPSLEWAHSPDAVNWTLGQR